MDGNAIMPVGIEMMGLNVVNRAAHTHSVRLFYCPRKNSASKSAKLSRTQVGRP